MSLQVLRDLVYKPIIIWEQSAMDDVFDSRTQNRPSVSIGDDLYNASIEELGKRIELLKAEIDRTEAAIVKKKQELSQAEALFGRS